MLRPLKKANAEMRQVLNKALKTEVHSPLCELYMYTYITWAHWLANNMYFIAVQEAYWQKANNCLADLVFKSPLPACLVHEL